MVPFQNFETLDGWIVVACPKQALWERLCRALDRPDLLDDDRYATFALRDRNRETLLPVLEFELRSRPTAEWLERLGAAGVPCAPVNDVAAALEDVQVAARGAISEVAHPTLGTVREVATPLRIEGFEPPLTRAPLRGEDTVPILRAVCRYSEAEIAALGRDGVFGDVQLPAEALA